MALRPVPGIRPHGAGQKPEAALSGATKDHRRPHCGPTPLPPAAIPRPSSRTGKILGHVPAVPAGASSANVQPPGTEVAWNRCPTAPGSHRDRKRRVVRGPGLLPDATLGEFIVRARRYGYTKHTIRIQELGARFVYLRRGTGVSPNLVELPSIREGDRLTRAMVERLVGSPESPQRTSACSAEVGILDSPVGACHGLVTFCPAPPSSA